MGAIVKVHIIVRIFRNINFTSIIDISHGRNGGLF